MRICTAAQGGSQPVVEGCEPRASFSSQRDPHGHTTRDDPDKSAGDKEVEHRRMKLGVSTEGALRASEEACDDEGEHTKASWAASTHGLTMAHGSGREPEAIHV
jgi:hypothetical protein